MNEAETRTELIDPALKAAGWGVVEASRVRREVVTLGRLGDETSHRQATSIGKRSAEIWRGISPASSKMLVMTGDGPG
jgi:Holliday junction resolvasome RuvABC endonuclease subunit